MRIAVLVLLVSIAALAAGFWLASPDLPERVASHSGADGRADGWMPRASYARTQLIAASLLSAALAGGAWLLSVPARDRWWSLPRRPAPE